MQRGKNHFTAEKVGRTLAPAGVTAPAPCRQIKASVCTERETKYGRIVVYGNIISRALKSEWASSLSAHRCLAL